MDEGRAHRFGAGALIMAVKRVTIELDDVPESARRTSSPDSLLAKKDLIPDAKGETYVPSRQADYTRESDSPAISAGPSQERIGRTPSDLVFAFVNRPEFVPTFLFAVAFMMSVMRIQKLADVWIPGMIGSSLNAIWFGIQGIRALFARCR